MDARQRAKQAALLNTARVHRDELLIFDAALLKEWFWEHYAEFRRFPVPNRGYATWIRQTPRETLAHAGIIKERVPDLAVEVLKWHHGGSK